MEARSKRKSLSCPEYLTCSHSDPLTPLSNSVELPLIHSSFSVGDMIRSTAREGTGASRLGTVAKHATVAVPTYVGVLWCHQVGKRVKRNSGIGALVWAVRERQRKKRIDKEQPAWYTRVTRNTSRDIWAERRAKDTETDHNVGLVIQACDFAPGLGSRTFLPEITTASELQLTESQMPRILLLRDVELPADVRLPSQKHGLPSDSKKVVPGQSVTHVQASPLSLAEYASGSPSEASATEVIIVQHPPVSSRSSDANMAEPIDAPQRALWRHHKTILSIVKTNHHDAANPTHLNNCGRLHALAVMAKCDDITAAASGL
ncbi:hypothetical protein HPB51_007877 [Rhipicephalus microplus]|uniref:Uncharacterized protein n=1 Tax=Rhipicephalus microplus TaxID=6941 RepID=A0A9J6EMG4_RHIMP|nr:hypothetical protein HPB51_007877 [Rhipicephalus microplus]